MTKMAMVRDINGYNTFGLPFTDDAWQFIVQSSDDPQLSITAPGQSAHYEAVFSFETGKNVWVAVNQSVTVPTLGDPTPNFNTSEHNPASRIVSAGDVLKFATPDTSATVWVGFYELG